MLFASLFRRSTARRAAEPRRFVPSLVELEGRALPSVTLPFKVTGAGFAPQGLPLTLNTPAPHNAVGQATHVGRYSGAAEFQLLSFTSATTGTFDSAVPFPFTAANGDKLTFHYGHPEYGAAGVGTFSIFPASEGRVYVVFVAEFNPVPEACTGRFRDVVGGSFIMTATTAPFVLGSTDPTAYSWEGRGTIVVDRGSGARTRATGTSNKGDATVGHAVLASVAAPPSGGAAATALPGVGGRGDRAALSAGRIDVRLNAAEAPVVIDAGHGRGDAAARGDFAIEIMIFSAA